MSETNGKPKEQDRNTKLMLAMGSKTGDWDPEPPYQRLWRMKNSQANIQKIEGWVSANTRARGRNSPFAVDENGRALTVKDLAAHFVWSLKHTENSLREAEEAGLIRWPGHTANSKIYLCAEKPAKTSKTAQTDGSATCTGGASSPFLRLFSPREIEVLEANPDRRKAAEVWAQHFEQFEDAVTNGATAGARAFITEVKYNAKAKLGLEVERKNRKHADPCPYIQLSLLQVPPPVQEPLSGYVYTNEMASVQVAAPIVCSDSDISSNRVGRSVAGKTHLPTTRLQAIHDLLTRLLAKRLHEEPNVGICQRVDTALQGAPLENLDAKIRMRFKVVKSYGFVADHLAKDVGKAWATLELLHGSNERDYQEQSDRQRQEVIAGIRADWSNLSAEDRAFYADTIPELESTKTVGGNS